VDYCDPYDEASIAAGLTAALHRAPEDHTEFLRGFSWESAAQETLRAYEYVLAVRLARKAEKTPILLEAC
jgi:hypothetical protein